MRSMRHFCLFCPGSPCVGRSLTGVPLILRASVLAEYMHLLSMLVFVTCHLVCLRLPAPRSSCVAPCPVLGVSSCSSPHDAAPDAGSTARSPTQTLTTGLAQMRCVVALEVLLLLLCGSLLLTNALCADIAVFAMPSTAELESPRTMPRPCSPRTQKSSFASAPHTRRVQISTVTQGSGSEGESRKRKKVRKEKPAKKARTEKKPKKASKKKKVSS